MAIGRIRMASWLGAVAVAGAAAGAVSQPAHAVTASAAWTISSVAEPTDFSSTHNTACEELPTGVPAASSPCDSYRIVAKNVGSLASSGTIAITDQLPTGVRAVYALLAEHQGEAEEVSTECAVSSTESLRCEYAAPVAVGGELILTINVSVGFSTTKLVTNSASIEGGSASQATTTSEPTTESNAANGPSPAFGIKGFALQVHGMDGMPDLQAGDHPFGVTTSFTVPSFTRFHVSEYQRIATGEVKDLIVDLPRGLVGDPQATPRCTLSTLLENDSNETATTACPVASRVGSVTFEVEGTFAASNVFGSATSAIFNIVPEAGYPAEFGFVYLGKPVLMYASALPLQSTYGLRVSVPGLIGVGLEGVSLTFFGDPARQDGSATASTAFLTNPVECAASKPLTARIEANSWEEPAHWVSQESTTYPQVTGCNMLQFEPTIALAPELSQADTPSGYEVDLKVPQAPDVAPLLATPALKGASVMLPEGVTVSPGAADGLVGCAERGPNGIELGNNDTGGHEIQEGEEAGLDGLPRVARGHCPAGSTLGTVEIVTPLLPRPLQGHIYLAQPRCGAEGQSPCTEASATNGELYSLYLEVETEDSGVIIKLKGGVSANQTTGQLTATFNENPQLPFSELKVRLTGGPRAPLANPPSCGTFTTTSNLTPWSAPVTPDASPSSSFPVTGCTSPTPFAPSFNAGTITPSAAGSSPFTLTLSRHDGEQNLSGISVTTPPGLVGMLSQVPLCEEPQAAQGECSEASRIGTTTVAAGAGSHPFWIRGNVYLTGPYNGAPFGLSVVVPAKAGPFNLGNVVVRSAINVDATTSALTVTSGPLPQIIDGVPFRLKTVNVTVDRPGFMLNPTNCEQQSINGTIAAAQGAKVSVSSPFAVGGCASLPFRPSFTVSTQARTSKAKGASLDAKVRYPSSGQANIKSVKVDLPVQLPSRLTTLQKACPAAVFESNPARCPPESIVGIAKASTPVLPVTLTGPAYLVSHAAEAFPNLVLILQGEGVRVDLTGDTLIRKGITSSTFASVPDVPVSSFELYLPEGKYSVLAANGNLCKQKLKMPTKITGQNGAVIKQTTMIKVTGCPKTKKARKATRARRDRKTTHVGVGNGGGI